MSVSLSPPMFLQFMDPNNSGAPAIGFQLFTYVAGTATKQATWQDSTQLVQNSNPIKLDGNGVAYVWLDPTLTYKFVLAQPNDTDPPTGSTRSVDNIQGPLTYTTISAALRYPTLPAETNTSVTIVNPQYPYGSSQRIGLIPNSSAAATANTVILKTYLNPGITNGPTGLFQFVNTTGSDVYWFSGVVPCRDGTHIDLQECTINLTGTGGSADSSSGMFTALRDFICENGSFSLNWATGPSTSSGNAIWLGARDSETSYFPNVYDSQLATPLGNCRLSNLRINSNVTGNVSGAAGIALVGGLKGVKIENVFFNGNAVLPFGIFYEFGWATPSAVGDPGSSSRATSHMSEYVFTNVNGTNMNNSGAANGLIVMGGPGSGIIDGVHFAPGGNATSGSNAVSITPAEAMYYRPWANMDDLTPPHITIRNVYAEGCSNSGVQVNGTVVPAANGTYLQKAWTALTVYVAGMTVSNDTNKMYVCTVGGTSAASGGPTGTGSGITDGGVTWNYVPLTFFTDLINFSLEGGSIEGGSAANGVYSNAGHAVIRDMTITGCAYPIVLTEECTRFEVVGNELSGAQNAGIFAAFTASKVWGTVRTKQGRIYDNFIWGNSVSGVGSFPGIQIQNCDGVYIGPNRIGSSAANNGVAEATQGPAIQIGVNSSHVICDGNICATASGVAYSNSTLSPPSNGNAILNPSGTATSSGVWDGIEQAWTPVLSCATPGDLAVTYTTHVGGYTKRGNQVDWWAYIVTSAFTYASASGNLQINGLPYLASATSNANRMGGAAFGGLTKASYTMFTADVVAATQFVQFYATGSAQALAHVVIGDLPSAGTPTVFCSGSYFI